MGSLLDNLQKSRLLPRRPYKDDLPMFQQGQHKADTHLIGLRKRLSSFSVKIQPLSASAEWALRRSKSMPSLRGALSVDSPLGRWWDWGLRWVLSRKPAFAQDIEMNEDETAALGRHSRGTLRHIFYRVQSEIRKLVAGQSHCTLPIKQQFRHDSFSYARNFDDGNRAAQQ